MFIKSFMKHYDADFKKIIFLNTLKRAIFKKKFPGINDNIFL